jgi:hypothetical protein
MQRTATTVLTVVAGDPAVSAAVLSAWPGAANVHAILTDPGLAALDRATQGWDAAARTNLPYALHDADPLAGVAEAWVRLFDGEGPVGELEVAVAETIARWRRRAIELPDYYLVVKPEDWPPTRRHFYLGVLGSLAPTRLAVTEGDLTSAIAALGTGPWWPDVDRLLDGIDRQVPDRVGVSGSGSSSSEPGGLIL